jgi:hypothetical protein
VQRRILLRKKFKSKHKMSETSSETTKKEKLPNGELVVLAKQESLGSDLRRTVSGMNTSNGCVMFSSLEKGAELSEAVTFVPNVFIWKGEGAGAPYVD